MVIIVQKIVDGPHIDNKIKIEHLRKVKGENMDFSRFDEQVNLDQLKEDAKGLIEYLKEQNIY